jgi:hypothetical protein
MKFLDINKIIKQQKVSEVSIRNILASTDLPETSLNFELACKSKNLYLEDITAYDDMMNSVDNKSHMYLIKNTSGGSEIMCFKPLDSRIQGRSLKARLADISTGYLIGQFEDDTFLAFFKTFYVPMLALVETYASMHKLRIPEDLCFFYKGGNLFRMLLGDISKLFASQEYRDLLKRSDADFQMYINPELKNYEKVFNDISKLVLYNLALFKKNLGGLFDFFKINEDKLAEAYKKEMEASGMNIKSISFVEKIHRKDFTIQPTMYNSERVVIYQEHQNILRGAPIVKVNKEFFISRNTALDFTRKDDLKSVFDLIRMKRNIKIHVTTDKEVIPVSVPCEIIDVSIPKKADYGMNSTRKNINGFIKKYHIAGFEFWAPSINYMIKDLDDILFKQSDYPWMDGKIDKRAIRYFVSLLFHNIMTGIMQKEDLVERLGGFKKEIKSMINFLECYIEKGNCDLDPNQFSRILQVKYAKLSKRINKIKKTSERAQELENFKKFNIKLSGILKDLIKQIDALISDMSKVNKKKLEKIHENLLLSHFVSVIGGGSGSGGGNRRTYCGR